jgi:hypothetical protein
VTVKCEFRMGLFGSQIERGTAQFGGAGGRSEPQRLPPARLVLQRRIRRYTPLPVVAARTGNRRMP